MTNLNFAPDYNKWWAKRNLEPEQAYSLALGVDPEAMAKALSIVAQDKVTDSDRSFWDSLFSYADHEMGYGWCLTPSDLTSSAQLMASENMWGNGKKEFLKNLYEKLIPIKNRSHGRRFPFPGFVEFISSKNEWPTHWDSYKDHTQYHADLVNLNTSSITNQEDALSILLELDPKWQRKFSAVAEKRDNWDLPSDEESFFWREYSKFLSSSDMYGDGWGTWRHKLRNAVKEMPNFEGNFSKYIQTLCNEGVIFPTHLNQFLESHCPNMVPEKESWAFKTVTHWKRQAIWSFAEACNYYAGHDLLTERSFIDGRFIHKGFYFQPLKARLSSLGKIVFEDGHEKSFNVDIGDYEDIRELASRHITANLLEPKKVENNEMYFDPKTIVLWLKENTCFLPPPALDAVLGTEANCSTVELLTHTGLPGRPTSKHLLEQEFARRSRAGLVLDTLKGEAKALRAWLIETHPEAPPPTEKVVQNNLRTLYNAYKAKKAS